MATHSSILAWKTPWTEEPDGLQAMGSQESDMTYLENPFLASGVFYKLSIHVQRAGYKIFNNSCMRKPGSLTARETPHRHSESWVGGVAGELSPAFPLL